MWGENYALLWPLVEGADTHMVEWWIIASNFAVGFPTMLLAWLTIREAHNTMNRVVAEQGKERRMILRLLRAVVRRNQEPPQRKHRK